jgi:ApaG protein
MLRAMNDGTRSTAVTHGIRVTVQSEYVPQQSRPAAGRYVFAYRVHLKNESHDGTVVLATRHWVIENQLGEVEEVRGPGVVGQHPRLAPGDEYAYTSGAILETPRGEMKGSYQFRTADGSEIDVTIAPFSLAMPHSLN